MTSPSRPPYPPAPPAPVPVPVRVPPGVEYHRLARGDAHRWWRPLTGTLLLGGIWVALLVLAVAVLAAAGVDLEPSAARSPIGELVDFSAALLLIGTVLPAVLLAARLGQRRPAGTVTSVAGRLRLRWAGWCALAAVPAIAVQLGVVLLLERDTTGGVGGGWVGWPVLALSVAVLLPLVAVQSAAEEYLARGWIVQAVGSWLRTPWPGIVLGGALWTALHVPSTWAGVADLMLFSLVTGWLTVRTGGLEAAVALHAVGNLAVCGIVAALGQLDDESTAGDAGWSLLAADTLSLPIYAAMVLALHRRLGLTRHSAALPDTSATGWRSGRGAVR